MLVILCEIGDQHFAQISLGAKLFLSLLIGQTAFNVSKWRSLEIFKGHFSLSCL